MSIPHPPRRVAPFLPNTAIFTQTNIREQDESRTSAEKMSTNEAKKARVQKARWPTTAQLPNHLYITLFKFQTNKGKQTI